MCYLRNLVVALRPLVGLMFLLFTTVGIGQETSAEFYAEARRLAHSKAHVSAQNLLTEALVSFPDDKELLLFEARLLFWRERYTDAESATAKYVFAHPTDREGFELLIDIYESQGQYTTAEQFITKLLKSYPEDEELNFRMAYNQSQQQNYTRAKDYCEKVLFTNGDNTKAIILEKHIRKKLAKNLVIAGYNYNFTATPGTTLSYYSLQYLSLIHI